MKPILFPSTATAFTSHGLGALSDCSSAVVEEERNGSFDLTFTVPITGRHFDEIEDRSLVLAKPNPYAAPQPFRVYRQSKPINGLVTFYAHHISYDLDGIPVAPFSATTAAQAIQLIKQKSLVQNSFTFSTTLQRNGSMTVKVPTVVRGLLGGSRGSLIDVYGGEFEFNGYQVRLLQARGENRGVKFRYGKNLVDLKQERNIEAVYTAVLPYWSSERDGLVQGSIRQAPGTFNFVRVFPLDLTDEFEGKPTVAQLNDAGDAYITRNKISTPKVSLSVSIVPPGSMGLGSLEEVHPWDTVLVQFERLGVDAEAQVVSYKFDVLTERYLSLELGDRRSSIADTIVELAKEAGLAPTTTAMQQAIKNATDLITGVSGGSVAWGFDSNGLPIELFFMDTNSIATAVNVLRINRNGIGFSTNGVNGPFETAWTIDGGFYAKWIVAGTIVADKIGTGEVKTRCIDGEAVTTPKLGPLAVTNPKIGGGAVSYGKTSFTGTLDQVGINKSDIAAINALFVGRLGVQNLIVNGEFYFRNLQVKPISGYLRY